MINICMEPVTLRMYHIAYKAVPFVTKGEALGLAQVVGLFAAAEKELGINSGLILPLFKSTLEAIEALNLSDGMKLIETYPLDRFFPESSPKAQVWRIDSPLGYPAYLIGHEKYSQLSEKYNHPNDLEIAFSFADAVLELLPRLGPAPDAVVLHDWQTAAVSIKMMQKSKFYGDETFKRTRTVGVMHDPNIQGRFDKDAFPQVQMGWDKHLPPWVEYYRKAHMLKALLHTTDISFTRSMALINSVIECRAGEGMHGIVAERVASANLVAIMEDDLLWSPELDLTTDLARNAVRHELSVLRSMIDMPFIGMEHSLPIYPRKPGISHRAFTPIEIFSRSYAPIAKLAEQLPEEDHRIVTGLIHSGQQERLTGINDLKKLQRLVGFLRLKIDPNCDMEADLRNAGMECFLDHFSPGDINRLFSLELDLAACKNKELLAQCEGQKTIPIYEALKRIDNLDHVIGLLKLLKVLLKARDNSETELNETIRKHGFAASSSDLWTLSLRFRDMSVSRMRPFLAAVLLHDIGNFVRPQKHDQHGRRIISEEPIKSALAGMFEENEIELIKTIVFYHLQFGSFVIDEIGKFDRIVKLWEMAPSEGERKILIDAMMLLSIADAKDRYEVTSLDHKRLKSIHEAWITAKDRQQLETDLRKLGFGPKSKGISRWDNYVLSKDKGGINRSHMRQTEKLRESFMRGRNMDRDRFFYLLGSFNIFPIKIMNGIADPMNRAKLFTFLLDLYIKDKFEVVYLEFQKDELRRLSSMLEETGPEGLRGLVKRSQEPGEIEISFAGISMGE